MESLVLTGEGEMVGDRVCARTVKASRADRPLWKQKGIYLEERLRGAGLPRRWKVVARGRMESGRGRARRNLRKGGARERRVVRGRSR